MFLPHALLFGLYAYNTSRIAECNSLKFDIREFNKNIGPFPLFFRSDSLIDQLM
jgi:hypothetical protein